MASDASVQIGAGGPAPEPLPSISGAEFRLLIERNADGILVLDEDGTVMFANPAASVIFGRSVEDLVGHALGMPFVSDETTEIEVFPPGGPPIQAEVRVAETTWDARPARLCSLRDISRRRELEERMRQAQKMEAVGQLTAGVAHDFNNLLMVIRSSTDLLRGRAVSEEKRRRYIDAISDTVDRAAKLTGQLLAFARRQALKPEVFDVVERVATVTEMLQNLLGGRIRINLVRHCAQAFVEADRSQFETALINLAMNARDAMDGEGVLTVEVDQPPASKTLGRCVAITVTDTGAGISAEQLTRIFEPFFTTKAVGQGTGLGLSQVYGFAKQSGGDVAVRSPEGQGAAFTLYLPAVDGSRAASPRSETPAQAEPPYEPGGKVLIVEDNPEVGRLSAELLTDLGYEPESVPSAQEALRRLAEGPQAYRLVFTDVVMPGMSGLELGQEIRRRYPEIPVVLTSGYSAALTDEGRDGFELLQKPYAVEDLSRVLRRAKGRSAIGRRPRTAPAP
ncbi:ATP-binding protein [Phenylobacterium sp. J367]|uniref:ATP-binding protein n=1 Tax=Phenylobacterium sp. J367 TaxID=2898435 RepID=UPI0021509741|nr:ATP-binding protein [Phenylobacterium sp. J367]MCR5879208.1 ATP-binding protein [Phenylobacterium sp. J367]